MKLQEIINTLKNGPVIFAGDSIEDNYSSKLSHIGNSLVNDKLNTVTIDGIVFKKYSENGSNIIFTVNDDNTLYRIIGSYDSWEESSINFYNGLLEEVEEYEMVVKDFKSVKVSINGIVLN